MEKPDNRKIYVVLESENPEIKVGNCYIFEDKNSPRLRQTYLDIETGKEMEVRYKYLCRRYELDDPEKKARINAIVDGVKRDHGEVAE